MKNRRALNVLAGILTLTILVCMYRLFAQQRDVEGLRISNSDIEKKDPPETMLRTAISTHDQENVGEWIAFKNWNEGQAVVAESDSIVWVGTAVGLVRWNVLTRSFQTFDETNGLRFTKINSLTLDGDKRLWMATSQGIATFYNGQFSYISAANSNLPPTSVRKIIIDNLGRIIVSTGWFVRNGVWEQGAICVLNGQTWDIYTIPNIYSAFGPPRTMISYRDTIWVSWHSLYILTNNQFSRFANWPYPYEVTSFAIDYQDSLWAETGFRTLKLHGAEWTSVIDRDSERIGQMWLSLSNDPRGGLWLSQGYGGPYRLDIDLRRQGIECGTRYRGICAVSGYAGNVNDHHARSATQQFFVDLSGLVMFNGSMWTRFTIPHTLLSNQIYGLGCSPSGEIYLTSPRALQKTDGILWDSLGGSGWINPPIRFRPDGSLWLGGIPTNPRRYVTGLDFDGYGAYWGAYGSVMSLSASGFREWNPTDMGISSHAQFMDISIDRNEHPWTAGWYFPAAMFDRTAWHLFPATDSSLVNYNYDRVFADSKGRVWFATNQWLPNYGFSMYDGSRWWTFYSPQSYFVSAVNQFAEDPFGNVWLATGSGLLRFDGSSFIIFDGLNSPLKTSVGAVAVDLRGNIWAGTNSGLYVYNPSGSVELGPYSFTSPVDSFAVVAVGRFAKATFRIPSNHPVPTRYQLQRGRGTHKFWTIAEVEYSTTVPSIIELVDSSTIIGQYYYRVREVKAGGKIRCSPHVRFTGGTPGVTVLKFDSYFAGDRLFLKWETQNEQFVQRFEVWRRDSLTGQFTLLTRILPDSTDREVKQYEIEGDSLRQLAYQTRFSLRVIYVDSTRSELRTLDITPRLPQTFRVFQNYPNPFNNSTTFNIEMPTAGLVTIKIYDILAREIPIHVAQHLGEGYQKLQLSMSSMASGVYLYEVESLGRRMTGKLVLLK